MSVECAQEYAGYLVKKGCTACTIHTYLTPVCWLLGINMAQINKPIRHAADFTRSYFLRVGPDDYVFTKEEVKTRIDLHAIRAACAKNHYSRYMEMFQSDEGARRRVYGKICARWARYNKRYRRCPPTWESLERLYVCRGRNREEATYEGRPYIFDRLALLAVSIFHLSHWRVGVTVNNYLLAWPRLYRNNFRDLTPKDAARVLNLIQPAV